MHQYGSSNTTKTNVKNNREESIYINIQRIVISTWNLLYIQKTILALYSMIQISYFIIFNEIV